LTIFDPCNHENHIFSDLKNSSAQIIAFILTNHLKKELGL